MSRWSLALLLVLALGAVSSAQEKTANPEDSLFADVEVGFDGRIYRASPSPVWLTLQNQGSKQRELRVVATSGEALTEVELVLPPGARQRIPLTILVSRARVLLRLVEGREVVEERLLEDLKSMGSDRNTVCFDGRPSDQRGSSRFEDSNLPYASTSPRLAPVEALCYRPFGLVIVRDADPDQWTVDQARALSEHALSGGTVIVTGASRLHPKARAFAEGFGGAVERAKLLRRPVELRRVGLGRVLVFPDDMLGAAFGNTPKSAQLKQDLGELARVAQETNRFARLFQEESEQTLAERPGVATKGLLLVFVIGYLLAVGPILAIALRKSNRRRVALVTAILIASFSALAFLVAGAVRTGAGRAYIQEVLYVPSDGAALQLADVTVASGGATDYDLRLLGLDLAATTLPVGTTRERVWTGRGYEHSRMDAQTVTTVRGRDVQLRLHMAPWDQQSVNTIAMLPGVKPIEAVLTRGPTGYVVRVTNTSGQPLRRAILLEERVPLQFSTPFVKLGDLAPGESREVPLMRGVPMNIYDERQTYYKTLGLPERWKSWAEIAPTQPGTLALRYRIVSRTDPSVKVVGNNLDSVPISVRIDPVTVEGDASHGVLGIRVEVGASYNYGFNQRRDEVRVKTVLDGPAKKAGIVEGMIIDMVNDQEMTSVGQFKRTLSRYLPGEKVRLQCRDPSTGTSRPYPVKLVGPEEIGEE